MSSPIPTVTIRRLERVRKDADRCAHELARAAQDVMSASAPDAGAGPPDADALARIQLVRSLVQAGLYQISQALGHASAP